MVAGTVAAGVAMTASSTRVGYLGQRRIAAHAVHRLALRIDGIDHAAERILQQVCA